MPDDPKKTSGGEGEAPSPSGSSHAEATKIQSLFRGYHTRKYLKVGQIQPGIIHVRITGDAHFYNHLNIRGIEGGRGLRTVHWLSFSKLKFNGAVVGGDELLNPISASDAKRREKFGPGLKIYINAGFFNARMFYEAYPEHATVGPANKSGKQQIDIVPIPGDYSFLYGALTIGDSYMVAAPVLVLNGEEQFDTKLLSLPAYQYKTITKGQAAGGIPVPPGALFHAGDPNPRAAIMIPHQDDPHGRIRLVVNITATRGPESDGFKMDEWMYLASRLCQLDDKTKKGSALNLDGGASVVLTVEDDEQLYHRTVQDPSGRDSSTFLRFTPREQHDPISPTLLLQMFEDPRHPGPALEDIPEGLEEHKSAAKKLASASETKVPQDEDEMGELEHDDEGEAFDQSL